MTSSRICAFCGIPHRILWQYTLGPMTWFTCLNCASQQPQKGEVK